MNNLVWKLTRVCFHGGTSPLWYRVEVLGPSKDPEALSSNLVITENPEGAF